MRTICIRVAFLMLLSAAVVSGCGRSEKVPGTQALHPKLAMKPVPVGLGVNIHFYAGTEQDWRMLRAAKIGMVRMDVSWTRGEPKPGQYNFADYDTLLSRLERLGMRLLFILDYGNLNYGNLPPTTDTALEASVRFVTALAKHFAGRHIIWELWNEPNLPRFWPPRPDVDAYVRWCKAVVPAIRAQDPQACIIGPATSRVDLEFLEACFKRGYLKLVDGVSVHPYRGADRGPETVLPEYEDLRTVIAQYTPADKNIPIVSGEWGYSTTWMPRDLQGRYLPRQWLVNLSARVPISIWYDWHDDGQDPKDPEHNFGTVTWDYKPKPAYVAMRTLTRELAGALPAGRLPVGSEKDFVLAFRAADSTARLALWTTGSPHVLDLGSGLRVTRAVDHLGRPVDIQTRPTAKLHLTDAPLYLSLASPLPDWLQLSLSASAVTRDEAGELLRQLATSGGADRVGSLGQTLTAALRSEDVRLRRTAWSAVVGLLERVRLSEEATVRLAKQAFQADLATTDKAKLVYLLSRRAPLHAQALVRSLPDDAGLQRAKASFSFQVAYLLAEAGKTREAEAALLEGLQGSSERHFAGRVARILSECDSTFETKVPRLANQAGFITNWWVAGPFPKAPNRRFFPELRFDTTDVRGEASWRKVRVNNLWGVLDFGEIYGKKPGVAYARAQLDLPEEKACVLKIGSNDGVVLFLNGERIHKKLVPRALTVDQDLVLAKLRKGKNVLLAKVVNEGANWQLCVRVCDANGRPINLHGQVY